MTNIPGATWKRWISAIYAALAFVIALYAFSVILPIQTFGLLLSINPDGPVSETVELILIFAIATAIIVAVPLLFLVSAAKLMRSFSIRWTIIPFASMLLFLIHPFVIVGAFSFLQGRLGE